MKLYIANGRYCGTQAEARKLDAKHDLKPVEFRTDKEGMIEDLNDLIQRARQMPTIEEGNQIMAGMEWVGEADTAPVDAAMVGLTHLSTPPVKPADIAAARALHAKQAQAITIEEAIAEADYPRAIRLAEHIHCRLMEHSRAGQAARLDAMCDAAPDTRRITKSPYWGGGAAEQGK